MNSRVLLSTLLTCLIGTAVAATLPRKAPDVSITLPGGKFAKVSDYTGKARIVMFFVSTCPHCQATSKVLSNMQKEFGPKGFQVIAGAMDDTADIPDFVRRFEPTYPVGIVDRMAAGSYMQLSPMDRVFVPFLVFIDRQGMIQAQYTGGDDFLKEEDKQVANIRGEILKILGPAAKAATTKKK